MGDTLLTYSISVTISIRDAYNQLPCSREKYLEGRTPLEALLDELKKEELWWLAGKRSMAG